MTSNKRGSGLRNPKEVHVRKAFVLVTALNLVPALTCAQESPRNRLEKSARHHEWVVVRQGGRSVHSFVVFPEVKDKVLAVMVIHENRGLTDWVRSIADQLAEAGYVAIAPDLLSGMGPEGGKSSDFLNGDAAREAIYRLTPEQVTANLNAVADYVAKLPASSGKIVVAGFCWGGGQAFRFATNRPDLAAAFVFYGRGPDTKETIAKIRSPVYGFYGGRDARVNATVPQTAALMKEAGKTFEAETYEGAGHGFMRSGEQPNATAANKKAREEAWLRWKALLREIGE
jgi:carboxymethylenebutenolidase